MADYKIKTNKKHGGKEFKGSFRIIGKVSQVQKKDQQTDSWEKQPLYVETLTRTNKPRRVLQFEVETAMSNRLRVELSGMEQQFTYPYSSTHKKAGKVAWADRNDKSKFPDDTYHPIEVDWDKAERLGKLLEVEGWYEVRGYYKIDVFAPENGEERVYVKRIVDTVRPIKDGVIVNDDGTTQTVKHNGEEFDYIADFTNEKFREVNYFNMQIGIRSTYQDEATGNTKVNAVFLDYGKERSEPKDLELEVFQSEVAEGKKSLADAFASLNTYDFIEVTGVDNNRATFAYVDVVETLANDDPFSDVDDSQKVVRKERVTNGDKKGLEITGYVANSLMRELLTEEELRKTAVLVTEDPFNQMDQSTVQTVGNDDPFSDPFASDPSAG